MLDSLDPLQDYDHLNDPEYEKGYPGVDRISGDHGSEAGPTSPNGSQQYVYRRATYPGLDTEPSAGDDRSQYRWNIRSNRAERSTSEDGKGYTVSRSRVSVENHRDKHNAVAEENGDHRLPPIHPRLYKPARQRVGRDHHA